MVRPFARMGVSEGHTTAVEDVPGVGSVVNYRLHPFPASGWVTVDGAEERDDFMMSSEVYPESGIAVDAAREVRIKLYNAQVGSWVLAADNVSDGSVQIFMGWLWLFHAFTYLGHPAPLSRLSCHCTLRTLDFTLGFGALLLDVEETLWWTTDESVPSLVPEAEATAAEPSTMGIMAADGVPKAIQGARD
jgi:hypothetical protein